MPQPECEPKVSAKAADPGSLVAIRFALGTGTAVAGSGSVPGSAISGFQMS
jgi:hypothetical protein